MRTARAAVAAFLATVLGISLVGVAMVPAAAVTDEHPDFILIAEDLEHILKQIQIAEAHAAGKNLLCRTPTDTTGKCVTDPALPLGLRTVDGSFNNLINPTHGKADEFFPRLLAAEWRQADAEEPPIPGFIEANDSADMTMCDPGVTCYAQEQGNVYDAEPRIISNLVVDQTTNNPAAVNAALNTPGSTIIDPTTLEHTPATAENMRANPGWKVFIPNTAADEALSAPFNAWFTFFGQFFDHGLDMVNKGGHDSLVVPLQEDDPLYGKSPGNFLLLTRATQFKDDEGKVQHNNQTTPFIDQNQTYTSHPAHQVFLREYVLGDHDNKAATPPAPVATGRLLDGTLPDGTRGGLATWADIKHQARTVLGINLVDMDVLNVPQIVADPYGNFTRGPNGFPLLVNKVAGSDEGATVEGVPTTPIPTENAMRTNHAFIDDIAHGAVPGQMPFSPTDLDEHFVTGDGRGNENIGLTSVHHVFHAEHNRMVGEIEKILDKPENAELKKAFQGVNNSYQELLGEPTIPNGPEADDWSYAERLFQAAKFPTEMQYQHLVFEEFARKIQPEIDAIVLNENSYDATINPAIVAEYAHVVYRFGHSMLTEDIERRGDFLPGGDATVSLLDGFLNPRTYDNQGTLTPEQAAGGVVNGTTNQVGAQIDEFVTDTLRNNLLGLPLDLATINMVRARDVGTPSLQTARETFFKATGDPVLRPYANWVDFGLNLKNGDNFGRTPDLECEVTDSAGATVPGADAGDPRCEHPNASLVNFVAAYGTHESITSMSKVVDKRAAADLIVNEKPGAPTDSHDFMTNTGTWAGKETGLNNVDFWVGGLAEALNPFGGMLGSTFNFVFEQQLENLQFGDRFYYLFRNQGNQLFAALENNSFAKLIKRNTEATLLPADIFAIQDPFIDLENLPTPRPAGLVEMSDGTFRWDGDEHIEIHGERTVDANASGTLADRIEGGQGDDALWGYTGEDRIEGRSGNDSIIGGEGDDILTDDFGFDNIKGGWGNDAIRAGSGDDLILGGHDNDFIHTSTDFKTIFSGTGDDILAGGSGRETSFAGEGDDWVEGGGHADLLQGDNANQFQNNPHGGDDVIDGGAGNDDMEGEGGDDVLIGRPNGTDRMEGMHGYDFVTYRGDTEGVDVDLRFTTLQRPDNQAVRDRFDLIEAVSGGGGEDVIRGMGASIDDIPDSDINKHKITEHTLEIIDGLEALLDPGHAQNYMLRFMPQTVGFDTDGESNLLLGGSGSDLFEGRVGDDFIDGDAYLDVYLMATDVEGVEHRYNDPTNPELQEKIFSGQINPRDIEIVRQIVEDEGQEDVLDTSIYTAHKSQYTVTDLGDGYWRVAHDQTETEGEEAEGSDILRNVELLRFANGCFLIGTDTPCGNFGEATITYDGAAPEEDVPVTGTVQIDLNQVGSAKDIEFHWLATDFEDVAAAGADWLTGAIQNIDASDPSQCTTADGVMTCTSEFTPGDAEFDTALRLDVTFLDTQGAQRLIISPTTEVGVVGRNDLPEGPVLSAGPYEVDARVSASGLSDNDGLEEAGETLIWSWQVSGSQSGPWTTVRTNPYNITGYLPTAANAGCYLRVVADYTDDHGTVESPASAATATTVGGGGTCALAEPAVAPAPLSLLSATPLGPESVEIVWETPTDTGSSALTGFGIRVFSGGAEVQAIALDDPTATRHTVTGLVPGTAYTFGVFAVNATGAGPIGGTMPATPVADEPGDTGGGDTGGNDGGTGGTPGGGTGGNDGGTGGTPGGGTGGDGGTGGTPGGGTGGDGGTGGGDGGTGGDTSAVFRMAGVDRFATAAEIATASFDPAEVDRVLLAVGDRFPDGLAGGPLAVSGGDPVLLTRTDKLPESTEDALRQLSPSSVVALGDTAAVSDQVLQQAAAAAGADSTERIGGADRYETAALIAAELPAPTVVYLAVGNNFPDSLAGGAATSGAPILLTAPDSLPAATAEALAAMKPERVVALGGPSSVPDSVLAAAAEAAGGATVDRMAGDDRYGTSVAIAEAMYPASTFSGTVYVAVGSNFPDSLSASSAAASEDAPLLLTRTDRLPDEVARWLAQVNGLKRVVVLGGPGTVSPGVMAQLDALID